eukprot:s100_g35.t1
MEAPVTAAAARPTPGRREAATEVKELTSLLRRAAVSKGGRVETLLRTARAGRTSLNTMHYNAAISSCKRTGDWKTATNWLCTMAQEILEIDGCSLHAAISACRGKGNWALALQLLCTMEQRQVQPVAARFGATLAVCRGHVSWPLAVSIWTAGCTRASDMPTEAGLESLRVRAIVEAEGIGGKNRAEKTPENAADVVIEVEKRMPAKEGLLPLE